MEEKIKNLIGSKMEELNLYVDHIIYEKENNNNFLRIFLGSDNIIDMDLIVKATNIINPILDEANIINETYYLEVSSKGSNENEES